MHTRLWNPTVLEDNSNSKLQQVKILHWLRNNMCLSFPDEGGWSVYILEHIWQPLQPFCQEKSTSNTISTWAFIIPVPRAKNTKTAWEGGEGKGGGTCPARTMPSRVCDSVLQCPRWFQPFPPNVPLASYSTFLTSPWSPSVFSPFLPPENTLCFL